MSTCSTQEINLSAVMSMPQWQVLPSLPYLDDRMEEGEREQELLPRQGLGGAA